MPVYVSMLRGINVGPQKRIKMDRLRQSCEGLGFEQVKTYIHSGNVIFKTGKVSPARLSKRLEERIVTDFGFSVSVISRTMDELAKTIENNPFLKEGVDLEKVHVAFLSDVPTPAALKKLEALSAAPDRSCCAGKEVYLYLPNGVAKSFWMKTPLDRVLSVITTTRNWKTVTSLHQMCQDCH